MSQHQQVDQFQAPASSTGGEPAIQTQEEMQNLLFNHNAMSQLYNLAQVMASGKSTVPNHLQGNAGDCMAVVMQAAQWRMNPFAVAQKTHVVQGTLGYEAQLVNAVITTMAPTTGRLEYEWFGDWSQVIGKFIDKQGKNGTYKAPGWQSKDEEGLGVRVWATMKGEEHPRVLELLLTQAQTRNSTLWASDPKQQLAYLAIKRWARLYCPDVILGVYTKDELSDRGTETGERDVTPKPQASPGAQPLPNTAQARTRAKLAEKRNASPATRESESVTEDPVDSHGEITADMVCAQINQAVTNDEMAEAIDLARHVPESDRAKVNAAYKARIAELKQPTP
ncbi:RecT family recombinase [Halomonas venusta]|uniref:RecT family recombinase n=1 Tax=Vreelandella venusta TaxID=44935 RepID=UPI00295E309F|nr:RecT family recombinase [Halomonas venusta]MDW0357757.1 RecT family recombinase [Halomonas venusta]